MRVSIQSIIDYLGDEIITVYGRVEHAFVDNLADSEHVTEYTLDWVNSSKKNKQEIAENSKAQCLFVDKSVHNSEVIIQKKKVLLVVRKPRMALAQVANHFFVEKIKAGIHPTAIIDSFAQISPLAHISAGCVVGKAKIGAGTVLMPNVVVYDNVAIGDNCIIQAGAVIGTDGLGCSRDETGYLTKFPHMGGVVIGDEVEIGANSQIAKGSFSDTIIERGCKLNGLCFVAHNCHLEENVWITGNSMLCGSVHIAKNTTIFSSVIIRDQRTIGEGVIIGMGSVVTKNVPDGETWVGNPARKFEKDQ